MQAYASCDNTVLEVPTKHDGEYNVKVLVHSPKVGKGNYTAQDTKANLSSTNSIAVSIIIMCFQNLLHENFTPIVQSLAGEKKRPAIVYAHGGGCIGGSAEMYKGFLAHMAVDSRVIVFNVDYRLAPETRFKNEELPE